MASCAAKTDREPTFAVLGRVVEAGKPAPYAQVVFPALDATAAAKPRGTTDADRRFTLTTYDGNDGAPAGRYRVTVERWQTVNPDQGPINRLSAKYANPDKSGLSAEVTAGPNELKPFHLGS